MIRHSLNVALLLAISVPAMQAAPQAASSPATHISDATGAKVLMATEAAKVLPETVFFRGQSAAIQARNSGGVQFTKDALMLVALVDTSGYSSSIQDKYQAYLIVEAPIEIEGHRLTPGAYGCGFIAGDNFIVMDIGGHDLFSAHSTRDTNLRRPTPLQVLSTPNDPMRYRLYVGRSFVDFALATPASR